MEGGPENASCMSHIRLHNRDTNPPFFYVEANQKKELWRREWYAEKVCWKWNVCVWRCICVLLSWSWSRLRCTDLGPTMAKIKRRSDVFSIVSMFVDRRKGHRSTRPLCTKAVWPRELDQMHLHSRYMFKSCLTRAVWCVYVHSFCPKKFGNEDIRQSMF